MRPGLLAAWLLVSVLAELPKSKQVIEGMAVIIRGHIQWNNWPVWSRSMRPFFEANFTYDFIYPLPKTRGIRDWYHGEHLQYNFAFPNFKSSNFLLLGTNDSASLQSYHTVRWKGDFVGIPAPPGAPLIKIKDLDFYIFRDRQIHYNWCMVDLVGILQQGGYQVLPPAPLPNGIDYLPPRAMDGIPSPDSNFVDPSAAALAMVPFQGMLQEDLVEQSIAARWWMEDLLWCGPAGIGDAKSIGQYVTHFLKPLHEAFSSPRLEMDSLVCEGQYCGAHFHLLAKHTGTWLGQPATGRLVSLRFGIHARINLGEMVDGCGTCGKIIDSWAQLDIVKAFAQMGVDLLARARAQYAGLVAATRQSPLAVGAQGAVVDAAAVGLQVAALEVVVPDAPAVARTGAPLLSNAFGTAFALGAAVLCLALRCLLAPRAASSTEPLLS